MGHSLLYVMVDAADADEARQNPDGYAWERIAPYEANDGLDKYQLSNDDLTDEEKGPRVTWRMDHRQARLELTYTLPEDQRDVLTPDITIDRLVELLNGAREYHSERYEADGDIIVGQSSVQPFPKTDWSVIGGRWTNEYALPPPWERPEETVDCSTCNGEGLLPAKTYILPRFLRLTAEARADRGDRKTCPRCEGHKKFTFHQVIEEAPETDFVKTIPEALALIEYDSEDCGPWALIDLDGKWHGPWGGINFPVLGEDMESDVLENTVLRHLRAAPEGTLIIAMDIHM